MTAEAGPTIHSFTWHHICPDEWTRNESMIFYWFHDTPEEEQAAAAARREYGRDFPPPLALFWYLLQARRWGASAVARFEASAGAR